MIPLSITSHRPDILQDKEMYEGVMQLELLLAYHKAGEKNLDPIAKRFPVDPVIIEEVVMEHKSSPSEEELEILCASGAQHLFENQKPGKTMRTSFRSWKKVVRTRLKKAMLVFPTPAQWLSMNTPGIGLYPKIELPTFQSCLPPSL